MSGGAELAVALPAAMQAGTGPDSIVLQVSEDAYANGDGTSDAKGDAVFTVSVDGKQVGGTFTATASHSSGQAQSFTINGTFGAGDHTVGVDFLNDAWAGSAATDRNLYIDGITANGSNANQSAALMVSGTQTFNIAINAPVAASAPVSDVSIPASQNQVTEQVNGTSIHATAGDHVVSLQGTHDTVLLTGGTETVMAFQGYNTITTGAGNDTISIGGSGNLVNAGDGYNSITDNGSGNTLVVPSPGGGFADVFGAVLQNGDKLDFHRALQATAWDHSSSSIGNFLHIFSSGSDAIVGISALPNGAATGVLDLHGAGQVTMATLLAHAMV